MKHEVNKRGHGRPRKYDSPEQFNKVVDQYLDWVVDEGKHITWTGMALYMGFSSRQSIDEYQKYDGFSDSVKRAKAIVEQAYEDGLVSGGIPAAGAIFALKNFNWRDKQELDVTNRDDVTPWGNIKADE